MTNRHAFLYAILHFAGYSTTNKETASKIPSSKRGPWGSPPQWTGIEGEHECEDWHYRRQNLQTYTQSTKTSVLSRQWLWRLLPRIRNPIWINATNTQESNSWPVAEVSYVPHINKVQTPRQLNRALLFSGRGQQTVPFFRMKTRFGRKQSKFSASAENKSLSNSNTLSKKFGRRTDCGSWQFHSHFVKVSGVGGNLSNMRLVDAN